VLRPCLVICILALSAAAVRAQPADSPDIQSPKWELTPYVGVAVGSPAGTYLGIIPDRNHLFLGIHANVLLRRTPRWTLGYAPEVVPLLVVSGNPSYRQVQVPWGIQYVPDRSGPVAGFAVSPIGLEAQLRIRPRWGAYAAGAAGAVWFSRDVPVPFSRRFNYTFEYGAGVMWRSGERISLRAGYKFHHLSNAYSVPNNPGLDGHVFLVGVTRAFGVER